MAGEGKDALAYFPDDVVAGRYRITGVLGRGGFAAVYAAEHLGTEQPVAIKMLSVAMGDGSNRAEANAIDRFQREARITAKLQHPNTVRVFDVGQDGDGALFLAMELLRGPTLEATLATLEAQQRTMTEAEGIEVVTGVLRSLGEAHAAGLVHRDLKPANVMLAEVPGCPPVVKVLDFGCTHTAGSTLTRDGLIMGTPGYMSPEQCRGQDIDARSDLYSVAVMLYRCVAGRPPFPDTDPMTLLFRTAHEAVPDPDAGLARPLQPEFRRVLLQALAKEPADRPASADEFRRLLDVVRRALPRTELAGTDSDTGLLLHGIVRAVGENRPVAARGPATAVQPRTDAYAAVEPQPAQVAPAPQAVALAALDGPTVVARPRGCGPSAAIAPVDVSAGAPAVPVVVGAAAPVVPVAEPKPIANALPMALSVADPGLLPTPLAWDASAAAAPSPPGDVPAQRLPARRHLWWAVGAAASAVGMGLLLGAVLRGSVRPSAATPPDVAPPAAGVAPPVALAPHPGTAGRPGPAANTPVAAEPAAKDRAAADPADPAAAAIVGKEPVPLAPPVPTPARRKAVRPAVPASHVPAGAERQLLQPRLME